MSGARTSAAWTEHELARLRPLAAVPKAPRGAVAAVAREIGRPPETVWSRVVAMRRHNGGGPAPAARTTFAPVNPWSATQLAVLVPLVRPYGRLPRGTIDQVAEHLGRTRMSVIDKLSHMRTWTDEELAAVARPPAMREAPRADGSGCLSGSLPTLTAAVQAHAPRTVSSAAGAVRAAPAAFHCRPPEAAVVERKCCRCKVVFEAASRFLFRCERCRGLDASGFDW
jgi:hypothetical protein